MFCYNLFMESVPKAESRQLQLKQRLLDKDISATEFLSSFFDLDQSTPERIDSFANLAVLKSADVVEILSANDVRAEYFNLLSVTHFHIAQQLAGTDNTGAKHHFESALIAAFEIGLSEFDDWVKYVDATVAYFNHNMERLSVLANEITDERNRSVVLSLLKGLRERGLVDYNLDYAQS